MTDYRLEDIEDLEVREKENLTNTEEPGSSFGEKLEAAGAGAINQFNLASDVGAAFKTATGMKPDDISQEDWDAMSLSQKYDYNKAPIQKRFNELEDRNPYASAVGNLGGAIIPALFTGGASLTGTIGSKVAPKIAAKTLSKVNPNVLKTAGQVADGSILAGTDAYMFERDPEKKLSSALRGAATGAAFPLALKGVGKALTAGGNKVKEYVKRAPEIIKQRETNPQVVSELQEKAVQKLDDKTGQFVDESSQLVDKVKQSVGQYATEKPEREATLVNKVYSDLRNFQMDVISKESDVGYDLLHPKKKIGTKPLTEILDENIKKINPQIDPYYPEYKKIMDYLSANRSLTEVEIKQLQNSVYNIIKSEIQLAKQGNHTPVASRVLGALSSKCRELLRKSNKKYAQKMDELAPLVEKKQNIIDVFGLDKTGPTSGQNTIRILKNYKNNTVIDKAIKDYQDILGKDLKTEVDYLNKIDNVLSDKNLGEDPIKIVDKITTLPKDSLEYKHLTESLSNLNDVDTWSGRANPASYYSAIEDLRSKFNIDQLNKIRKLFTEKDGLTKFTKSMKNLRVEDPKPKNAVQRVLSGEPESDIKTVKAKDKQTRKNIELVSEFLEENSDDNIRAVENMYLYDALGTGATNGSRNVNLGAAATTGLSQLFKSLGAPATLGGVIGTFIGSPAVGAGVGATLGALKDKGVLSRLRRELLDQLYNPANTSRNNRIGNALKYEGELAIPREYQKEKNRQYTNQQAWEDMLFNDPTVQVATKKASNKKWFKREGS